ncbi:MAG: hypothetical protein OXB98_03440 [Bryobacterales bacterium]|nr:hypothetical protein [Bryobacterales bacterium]
MHPSGSALNKQVEHLRCNHTSGALDLALEAIDLAGAWMQAGMDLHVLAAQLQRMHPAIAAVRNVGRLLLQDPRTACRRLEDLEQSLRGGNQRIAAHLKALIAPAATIITLSNSSTVRHALISLRAANVFVMESLPGMEGRSMAQAVEKQLKDVGVRIQLIPDAMIGNVVPQVDCALVGIDTFDISGAIYHKVGTLPLALCCRQFDKPLYAAGHSLKCVDGPLGAFPESDKPFAAQIFDLTPPQLITRIITEE